MTALLVVFMFVAFVALDALVRIAARRIKDTRLRREREAVLETAVRLDFTHEAKSLKRVAVPEPRGRILAVDDEPVVLDAFRKILVLDGYSVDTVESGAEALGLVHRNDYDFVFTDLKMPGMDGVEVVKAVKHVRPDVDVVVITGYGSIETAVETMQHGAVEYFQKPFTADELIEFARKLSIRREARLEASRRPTVRIVTPDLADVAASHEYCVPGGVFLSDGHAWARIEPGGEVRVGLDDFARKALGAIDAVELPQTGRGLKRGEPLFTVRRGSRKATFLSPFSGRVVRANDELARDPARASRSPYDRGWVCLVQPDDLSGELSRLRIGRPLIDWYQEEIARLRKAGAVDVGGATDWESFGQEFLEPAAAGRR